MIDRHSLGGGIHIASGAGIATSAGGDRHTTMSMLRGRCDMAETRSALVRLGYCDFGNLSDEQMTRKLARLMARGTFAAIGKPVVDAPRKPATGGDKTEKKPRRQRRIQILEKHAADLLRTREVQSISFLYGGTLITPGSWTKLADAMMAGTINIDVRPFFIAKQRAGAVYVAPVNTIYLRSFGALRFAGGRGLVVHEGVHALQDIFPRTFPVLEAEGAAFLAEAWYHLECGSRHASPFWGKMLQLVNEIRTRHRLNPTYPIAVTLNERKTIEHNIRNRGYKPGIYENDGWND